MPWGECTITLEDVAYQLGLSIDGEPVSGCLWNIENMMPDGTGRSRWDFFRDMFCEPPAPPVAGECIVTFLWLRSTLGVLPDHPTNEMVLMHARAYIWMLLLICLFVDKTGARAHVDTAGARSAILAVQEPMSSSQQEYRPDGRAVGSAAELDFLVIFPPSPSPFDDIEWPLASRWSRFLPSSDKRDPRLQRLRRQLDLMPFNEFVCLPYRTLEVEAVLDRRILQEEHRALWCSIVPLIYFGTIEWHQVDQLIPQFGGVQNRPHRALNIDFLNVKDGRGSDQWFPQTFRR
ncbi:hypothetical protein PIB30_053198 [Stylosanthes scabra]|uniref:Aminotransferase-like plant mobile domain-containing protein n=1 Tax=Stylosanthes scabra TaxID=79078 RepID=A0ABU6YH86_9FABA|nr:hypothetical protein [Stylosanthes scabra]